MEPGDYRRSERLGHVVAAQSGLDLREMLARLWQRSAFPGDAAICGKHGGVIAAAEELTDVSERARAVVSEQVHGDVAGEGDFPGSRRALELVYRQVEVAADGV